MYVKGSTSSQPVRIFEQSDIPKPVAGAEIEGL